MKLNLVSDLHVDFDYARQLNFKGGNTLLIAGDLCEVGSINPAWRIAETRSKLQPFQYEDELQTFLDKAEKVTMKAEELKDRLNTQLDKYDNKFAVLGNHEFYNSEFDLTKTLYREALPGVTLLDNESVELSDNVVLFGGTLWTNLDNHSPLMESRAARWSDYSSIVVGATRRRLLPSDTYAAFDATVAAIYKCAVDNPDKEVVIMTHFAPSEQSVHPRFKYSIDNAFFYSSLEDVIMDNHNIKAWVHGHMHNNVDYNIGQCRVMCNPRGYVKGAQQEKTGFKPNFSFEIGYK